MTPLRELIALFDVDTSTAEVKLKRLSGSTDIAKNALAELAITALGAFSAHAIVGFVEEMIDLGSVINDTSERLGVSTEELQKFQMAAKLSGVDSEEAAKALGFLNRNMGEALGGSKEAAQQFAELDIAIKDGHGNVRDLGDVVPEVADAFQKMGSDQERTAAAMKLFGRSGASLLPLLKQGSGELKKMSDQFDALGLGIDDGFIKKADKAGDEIDILKLGFRTLKTRIASEILPYVTKGAQTLQGWTASAIRVTKETNIVSEAWMGLGATAAFAAGKSAIHWSKMLGLIPKNADLLTTVLGMGKTAGAVAGLGLLAGGIEDVVVFARGGESVLGDFFDEFSTAEEKQALIDSLNKSWDDMKLALTDLGPALISFGKVAAEVLPFVVGLVADLIKAVLSAMTFLMGLGEFTAHLVQGHWSDLDRVAAEQGDKQANIWKTGSTLANMLSATSTPAELPATRVLNGRTGDVNMGGVNITVQGGPTNEDTGRAVRDGVRDSLSSEERRTAARALFHGPQGGDDDG